MHINVKPFILLVLTAFAAFATGHPVFSQLSYVLLTAILLSFIWTWFNLRWVRLERAVRSRRAQVGRIAEEKFTLVNRGLLPKLWLEVRDETDLLGYHAGRVVPVLSGRGQVSWTARTVCQRRGTFTLGPTTLLSRDPFGLVRMTRTLVGGDTLVVYPATVDLLSFTPPMGRLPGGDALRRRTHYVTTNVAGVREYYPGDSFNRIHWPSTARHERLIVKEFELDPSADIWLFLDMQRDVQVGAPLPAAEAPPVLTLWAARPTFRLDPTTEEYGVTIAASLARHFIAQDKAVGLVAYGQRREIITTDRGERQLNKILEALAIVRAEGRASLAEVIATEEPRLGRHITVIVITPSPWTQWVGVLRDVERRGSRAMAVVLDASTFGPARGAQEVLAALVMSGIPAYRVGCDDKIEVALSRAFAGARLDV